MSLPNSTSTLETTTPARSPGSYRKPRADLYTVFLVLALIAVLLGILFLCLYMGDYEWKLNGGPPVPPGARSAVGNLWPMIRVC